MQRNYNNEFERFLKENADQYRLYPSAKVWKGVYAALHTRRRWVGLGIVLLLMTGSLITLLITNSAKQAVNIVSNPVVQSAPYSTVPIPGQLDLSASPSTFNDSKLAENNITASITKRDIAPDLTRNSNRLTADKLLMAENNNPLTPGRDITNNESSAVEILQPVNLSISDEIYDQDISNPVSTNNSIARQKITTSALQNKSSWIFDWTIESVLNSYHKNKKRLNYQLYITPTVSYRKLSENKSFMNSSASTNIPYTFAALYDINSAVTHKPDMGLELGVAAKYSLASNFKLLAGIQFNVSRYDIKAFNYPLEVATIALNDGSQVDSFHTVTSYRNFNGTKANWLQNLYFQISVPVGVEVLLAGDDKVQVGMAGTLQPTYVLGDRAYMLSTDYKNYAEVPWLIRRWNVNTALETFVAYSTGKLKWQVGPQVRYQLLSSFVNKYPVKENLFDFGLKVGISLNQ